MMQGQTETLSLSAEHRLGRPDDSHFVSLLQQTNIRTEPRGSEGPEPSEPSEPSEPPLHTTLLLPVHGQDRRGGSEVTAASVLYSHLHASVSVCVCVCVCEQLRALAERRRCQGPGPTAKQRGVNAPLQLQRGRLIIL